MKSISRLSCISLIVLLAACSSSSTATPTEAVSEKPTIPSEMAITPTEIEDEITFIRTQGGNRRDRGINLLQTNDGGYAIVGYTSSGDAIQEDVYLVRLSPQGEVLWSRTYGGERKDNGWDLLETEEGGFIVVGFTNSFGEGGGDMYIIKVNQEGEAAE
ncbi:MAG: hypothetical protein GTO18_00530 [Anaerolineales bacterium]|nr:hypothetical protein [Anaerolineales bacterium]